jgi:hypothetical protein
VQSIDSSDVVLGTYYIRCTYKDIVGLNLNPYPGHVLTVDGRSYSTYQKIGLPVYVYLLPSYCRINGFAIDDSVEDVIVNFTTDPTIFDTESDYYNRLAILIGIVSCTTPVTPDDVILLDARSRGGGAEDTDDTHYFDVDYFVDKSYPEKGFLIIDASVNDKSREAELISGIEKNIAAGTIYKIRWMGFCLTRTAMSGDCTASLIAPTVSGGS